MLTLTLVFDLLHLNFNLDCSFWMVDTGALIFLSCEPFNKIFPWVPKILTMWPWPWCLVYLLNTWTLAISFEWYAVGFRYFTRVFFVIGSFCGYQQISCRTVALLFNFLAFDHNATNPEMQTSCNLRCIYFCALWDLYRATPAVTRDLGFSGLIRRTAPISHLLRHAWECGGPILTRILTGV
jgi:hypothetical protein